MLLYILPIRVCHAACSRSPACTKLAQPLFIIVRQAQSCIAGIVFLHLVHECALMMNPTSIIITPHLQASLAELAAKSILCSVFSPLKALMQCRALTTCVLWEISMQNLQPIIDWRKEVADILVRLCMPLHAELNMT